MTTSDQNTPGFDTDAQLEQLFAEARKDVPEMPDALVARMLGDAYDAQPQQSAAAVAPATPRRQGFGAAVFGFLGGWSVATALGLASAVGMTVGYAGPDLLPGVFEETWVETGTDGEADPFETLLSELGS